MITTLFAAAAVLLSLALPIFPQGLSLPILAFLGLTGLAGLGGFVRSPGARAQLVLILPWALALAIGIIVGMAHGNATTQLLEDSLPYLLFTLGLAAGRGCDRPRLLLTAVLAVCLADSVISLYRMPSYDLSKVRSTFFYFKIIAGTPLVGIYLVSLFPRVEREWSRRSQASGHPVPANRRFPIPLSSRMYGALTALLILTVFATVSRGMITGLLLGLGAALYMRKPTRALTLTVLASLGLVLFAPALWQFGEQYLRFGSVHTVSGRMREIVHCLYVFASHPILGMGLGAEFVVDSHVVSYVHNMLAYHLWKFGLLGSALLSIPLLGMAHQAFRAPHEIRAVIFGGAISVLAYLVTCASYKNYTLVPMLGIVVGASLSLLAELRARPASPAPAPTEAKDLEPSPPSTTGPLR